MRTIDGPQDRGGGADPYRGGPGVCGLYISSLSVYFRNLVVELFENLEQLRRRDAGRERWLTWALGVV